MFMRFENGKSFFMRLKQIKNYGHSHISIAPLKCAATAAAAAMASVAVDRLGKKTDWIGLFKITFIILLHILLRIETESEWYWVCNRMRTQSQMYRNFSVTFAPFTFNIHFSLHTHASTHSLIVNVYAN